MSKLQNDWENVYSYAEQTINKAMKKNSSNDYEAYFSSYETIEVTIRNSEILTQNKMIDSGIGIRTIIDGQLGFSCCNKIDQKVFDETLNNSVSVAKMSLKDANIGFPDKSLTYPDKSLVCDVVNTKLNLFNPGIIVFETVIGL